MNNGHRIAPGGRNEREPTLFQDARIGTCECCESDEKPVVTFTDEFGTTLCEGCYLACVGQVSYGRE